MQTHVALHSMYLLFVENPLNIELKFSIWMLRYDVFSVYCIIRRVIQHAILVTSHARYGASSHRQSGWLSDKLDPANNKENVEVPRYWIFVSGIHRWIPSQRVGGILTSSNGNIFRVTGHLKGNSPVTDGFPSQRPVARSFDVFFDLRLNKRLSKQSWAWWFETQSHSL